MQGWKEPEGSATLLHHGALPTTPDGVPGNRLRAHDAAAKLLRDDQVLLDPQALPDDRRHALMPHGFTCTQPPFHTPLPSPPAAM